MAEASLHQKDYREYHIKIILVFCDEEKCKAHASILQLYPLLTLLRFRESKGGRLSPQARNEKHQKAGNSGIRYQRYTEHNNR